MNLFPSRLKRLRKENNLSQKELANKIGYSRTTIANYEQDLRLPSADVLNSLADFFEVSLDYLFGRANIRLSLKDYLSKDNPNALLFINPNNGKIINCSPAALSCYGYTKKELLSKTIFDLNTLPKNEVQILMNKAKNKSQQVFYFKHKIANGKIIDVKVTATTLIIEDKTIVCSLIEDITYLGEGCNSIINHLISTLSKANLYKTPYKKNHPKNVSALSHEIGIQLDLPVQKLKALKISSLLHDIGELNIPDDILNKPSQLTKNEFNLIKDHPVYSAKIIKDIPFEEPIADIILQHHERIDGSGYPSGLTNNNISLEAKIIAVADVVEAMTSKRPYRQALDLKDVLYEIKKYRNIKYDKDVVDICIKIFKSNLFKLETCNYD